MLNLHPFQMSSNKIFSLFQEFSEEQKAELEAERTINSDALLIDGMNTFMLSLIHI